MGLKKDSRSFTLVLSPRLDVLDTEPSSTLALAYKPKLFISEVSKKGRVRKILGKKCLNCVFKFNSPCQA